MCVDVIRSDWFSYTPATAALRALKNRSSIDPTLVLRRRAPSPFTAFRTAGRSRQVSDSFVTPMAAAVHDAAANVTGDSVVYRRMVPCEDRCEAVSAELARTGLYDDRLAVTGGTR